MRHPITEKVKQWIRPLFYRIAYRARPSFECPICGYRGPFKDKRDRRNPRMVRQHSKCVGCGASERHRMQHLVIKDLFKPQDVGGKSILHIAPEWCLTPLLKSLFGTYHTADLFRKDVDFNEDLQKMSFPDSSYDCVIVSRVLAMPQDLEACVREMRRVLRPGGTALICEAYTCEQTTTLHQRKTEHTRELGMDAVDLYRNHFDEVICRTSDMYDPKFQLLNRILVDGEMVDTFPAQVREPGIGYKELVAVCRVRA